MTLEEFKHRPLDTAINPFNPESMKVVVTGSSDVGDVSYLVPTAQIMVAASIPGTSPHTWQFTSQMGTSFSNKACIFFLRGTKSYFPADTCRFIFARNAEMSCALAWFPT